MSGLCRIVGEGGYETLKFERRLHHPVQTVWSALTDPGQLADWFMTKGTITGGTGGTVEFWSGPYQLHVTGSILVWDPSRIFEHEWNVEPSP